MYSFSFLRKKVDNAFTFPFPLSSQMAIKSFDKSKLKSVGMLEQSTAQVTDTGCSGEFVEDADTAAPHRSKLMQRRHTVNVPLPAEGSDSGSGSPADPAPPQAQHWQGSGDLKAEAEEVGGVTEFQ